MYHIHVNNAVRFTKNLKDKENHDKLLLIPKDVLTVDGQHNE